VKDYYQILGVDRQATDADIKKAYRKLASQHHPDRGGDANAFKQVQEAYDILSDNRKRAEYDNPQGFFTQRGNFDDILNQYFTHFDVRSQMRNTRAVMWISMKDVATGGERVININNLALSVEIPPGVNHCEAVRYPQLLQGNDLIVEYRIHGHPVWQRDGLDLLREVEFDFWECLVGTEKSIVDLYDKTIKIKLPEMSRPGTMLRLQGKGLARRGHNTGDMFVKVKAVLPNSIPINILDAIKDHQNK